MTMFKDLWVVGASLVLAGVMGYAIQRGATCTVAAVGEIVSECKFRRLWAIIEAAIWVLGGLLLGNLLGVPELVPSGYQVSFWTFAGALLLGVGAAVNKACVFGSVARFGNGDWAYSATPLGFYLGCLLAQSFFLPVMAVKIAQPSVVLAAPGWLLIVIGVWMVRRAAAPVLKYWADPKALVTELWAPHSATLVIGVTFVLLLWLVGPWAYTDLLAELARGGMPGVTVRVMLLLTLLIGAIWGGWTASCFRPTAVSLPGLARCLSGGILMGAGSLAIPGGNDGLVLTGLPLLWPHAWIAFATMCASIALYLQAQAYVSRHFKILS